MPFTAAPIACSRTPKATLRPLYPHTPPTAPIFDAPSTTGWKSPKPFSAVLVDGFRSAEPPMILLTRFASTFITSPPATRVATALSVGFQAGMSAAHSDGSFPETNVSNSAASAGNIAL